MGKQLSEMTLEELWQLFPIILTAHQGCWKEWYQEEEALLKKVLPQAERISHIGSTAVSSIWAKPIIDILVEVPGDRSLFAYKDLIVHSGYLCMWESEKELSFNKGYTENGFAERVFHLHLRYTGNNHELYFRDYLNQFPDIAKEYETLKRSLWKAYEHDRDAYTNAKTEFVTKYTTLAKEIYDGRY
ncbi:MAG: GrpB family protein [Oscillospiraceae bacterium]|nr:GrpB family protein [Oscillospiraceae bacterium]